MSSNDFTFDPNRSIEDVMALQLKDVNPQGGIVKHWSFSSLMEFETCPYRIFLKVVKNCKTEQHPKAARGVEVHDALEKFVVGEVPDIHAVGKKHFEPKIIHLRDLYVDGQVTCEEEWAFTIDWAITGWKAPDVWAKIIQDVFIHAPGDSSAKIIDYKTGRKDGNELKHSQQALIYAIAAFKRYPELEYIEAEFWYLDEGTMLKKSYTREYANMFSPRIELRAKKLTSEKEFIAKPSAGNCKYCSYGKEKMCDWYTPV